ncbi:MAG: DEAD/DEAH box helicase, partial [Myxococcota bacterium]
MPPAYPLGVPFSDAHPALLRALTAHGYDEPTDVQRAILAPEARGRDLFVSSRTGSGKTIAFGLAIAPDLLGDAERVGRPSAPLALVIAPTRELAQQVHRELQWLYGETGARVTACTGGSDVRRDLAALRDGAHVIVGTPGRLCDLLDRGQLDLHALRAVVLDEADEMLDLGFRDDLERLLDAAPAERRTLLFCATSAADTKSLAEKVQREALRIVATDPREAHADIEYRAVLVSPRERDHAVVNVLRMVDPVGAIVFCATRDGVGRLHANLVDRGFAAVAISGELTQAERTRALQSLRDGRAKVLVATDVAARGLDLPSLDLVVHADLPHDPQVLQHRSGRTGRAGRKGIAVIIVPTTRRALADRLFRSARIQPSRGYPPTLEQIEERDRERLCADIGSKLELVTDDDRALAKVLLETHPAEALAALLVATRKAQLPAAEDLRGNTEAPRVGTRPERPRPGGAGVWFRINVGRAASADPRSLLPLLCRHGRVTRRQIGRIEVDENESRFEVHPASADRFEQAVSRSEVGETGVQ